MIKAPAPHLLHCQGNLHKFPRPTAEPTAASQKVTRPDHESRSSGEDSVDPFVGESPVDVVVSDMRSQHDMRAHWYEKGDDA